MPRIRCAFTLIELLVVIGIIALLVGILLPVLGAARRTGKTAVCANNLKTLGQATMLYTQDFDRYLPQPVNNGALSTEAAARALWFNAVDYYLDQVNKNYASGNAQRNHVQYKQDPVWLDVPEGGTTVANTPVSRENQRTFKMNDALGFRQGTTWKSYRITEIKIPSSTVMYADARAFDTPSTTTGNIDTSPTGMGGFGLSPALVGLRHEGGANVGKIDGSVSLEQNNARLVGANGYVGWHLDTNTPANLANRANWPNVIFDWENREY